MASVGTDILNTMPMKEKDPKELICENQQNQSIQKIDFRERTEDACNE